MPKVQSAHPRAFDIVRTSLTTSFRSGMPIEVAATLLTHRSPVTTGQIYVHLGVEDLRVAVERSGVWKERTP